MTVFVPDGGTFGKWPAYDADSSGSAPGSIGLTKHIAQVAMLLDAN